MWNKINKKSPNMEKTKKLNKSIAVEQISVYNFSYEQTFKSALKGKDKKEQLHSQMHIL